MSSREYTRNWGLPFPKDSPVEVTAKQSRHAGKKGIVISVGKNPNIRLVQFLGEPTPVPLLLSELSESK